MLLRIALLIVLAGSALAAPLRLMNHDWGVTFAHRSGPSLSYNPEVIGPGVALPDFDGDGRPDLYLVNGGIVGADGRVGERPPDALYRSRPGGFDDVTAAAGVAGAGIGNGVLAADLDNDGYVDLYLTGYAEGLFYHNNGDGTFTESGAARGLPPLYFAATAAAGDVDRDGHLDLYVANYLEFDYRSAAPARVVTGPGRLIVDALGPSPYLGRANHYLHARGDGVYEDLTDAARAGNNETQRSRSLGALIADLDADGWPEILVANDQAALAYYRPRGRMPFEEAAARAYLQDNRGNMGLAVGDYDADGALDLFVSHFDREHNALYRGSGPRGRFRDTSLRTGLSADDHDTVGWGAAFVDLDADGWPDLVVANGHVFPPDLDLRRPLPPRLSPIPQRVSVYHNRAGRDFEAWSRTAIEPASPLVQGRGLAVGDLDGDLVPDLAVAVNNGPPLLLRNEAAPASRCAVLDLVGTRSNRAAVGARVEATLSGPGAPPRTTRLVTGGNGYLSSDAASVYLGVGPSPGPVPIMVTWPSGLRQSLTVRPGERLRVVEP